VRRVGPGLGLNRLSHSLGEGVIALRLAGRAPQLLAAIQLDHDISAFDVVAQRGYALDPPSMKFGHNATIGLVVRVEPLTSYVPELATNGMKMELICPRATPSAPSRKHSLVDSNPFLAPDSPGDAAPIAHNTGFLARVVRVPVREDSRSFAESECTVGNRRRLTDMRFQTSPAGSAGLD